MKRILPILAVTFLSPLLPSANAADATAPSAAQTNVTRAEARQAIEKGLAWLKAHQNEDGSWSNSEQPGLTALPIVAIVRDPVFDAKAPRPEYLQKALAFIRSKAKPDGSIWEKGLSNYNTSVCLTALVANGDPKDDLLATKCREFIIGLQAKNMADESFDGGIGYGTTGVSPSHPHPDLDNTLIALEALRTYKDAHPEVETSTGKDLNWQAAIDFVTRCQNLPEKNPKASTDPADRGGFIYYPGYSNAAPTDGSAPLRSYGSMTYAGLLSYIYADLKKDDPRVQAAVDWLKKNYSLDKNPGMGASGLYYYIHLMTKGLSAAGIQQLETADGRKVDWAHEVARKIMEVQTADGSWVNTASARWMEKDPVLVTTYCVMALELLDSKL